jgi:hypothetical protein
MGKDSISSRTRTADRLGLAQQPVHLGLVGLELTTSFLPASPITTRRGSGNEAAEPSGGSAFRRCRSVRIQPLLTLGAGARRGEDGALHPTARADAVAGGLAVLSAPIS